MERGKGDERKIGGRENKGKSERGERRLENEEGRERDKGEKA